MKKRNFKKSIALISAAATIAQLSLVGTVFAESSSQTAAEFVFSDSGISVTSGNRNGYKITGTTLTIQSAGTYEVSGSCSDGSIKVKKGTEGVNLILNGLTLSSSDTAPLCFNKSSEVTLTAKENTVNNFADTEKNNDDNFADNENAENAVIKCKDGSSVVLNGSGTVNITANGKNGIKSGETTEEDGEASLTIDGVILNINAPINDAVNAESTLTVKSGTLTLSAEDDALHSDYVLIIGEENGGSAPVIRVLSCYEGLEGANVSIYSGDIEICSEDDGINAANSDLTDYAYTLDIYGGKIHIDAEKGDGIDSNGTLTISGGTVEVFSTSAGDNSPLDSDGALTVTGGTVLAVGNSGMAQTPENGSQNYIVFGAARGFGMQQPGGAPENAEDAGKAFGNENGNALGGAPSGQRQPPSNESGSDNSSLRAMRPPMQADGTAPEDDNRPDNFALPSGTGANLSIAAGDILTVTNEENTVLYRATAVRSANYVLYSSADLDENETYTLNINGTASGTATVSDSAQSAPSGMPGFGGNTTPPDGTGNGQNPPTPPSGGMTGAGMPGGNAPGGGAPTSYTAANTYSESTTLNGKTFSSTGTDENAVLVTGGDVVLRDSAVTRNSSDSTGGDSASFYGVGAAGLVTDGNLYIKDSTVSTDAKGGAGVFAYGNGTAYVADTEITTKQDTSGGIHAAGGGTLYAWDLDVTTDGESSAAIRSDRGGGKMVIDGGSYVSDGKGSPAVYSTADIAVNNATLTANGSEAVCIEGLNSLSLYNSTLSGNMSDDAQNDTTWTVIVYQSMSGDSEIGCGKFSMKDGKLISNNGGIFYTTNTESEFYLENTEITAAEDAEFFLRVTGNQNKRGWGTVGANGADCLFTAANQEMNGDIVWDKISTLKLYIANGSTLTGAVLCDATYDGNGSAALYIDESSSWVVTGNSTLTALYCAGSLLDKNGKTVSVVSPDGTVLKEGDSEYTVTAKEYADTADMSKMGTYTEWSEYETEKPSFFEASSGSGSSGSSSAGSSSGSSSSGSSSAGTAEKPTADDKKNEDLFDDVSRDDWFYDAVKFAWENGFMKGTSEHTFSPEAPLSRAMLITVLYRPEGQPAVKALDPTPFTDIDTNDYCFDAVAWAKENAILYGVTDTTFAPNQNVTREQLAAVLYRYAKYKGTTDSETEVGSERQGFSDTDEISDYVAEAVGYCRRAGFLKGKDNNLFAPNEYAVRAQIAAVLQRIAK